MPVTNSGASIPDWYLQDYPGLGGAAAPATPIDQSVAALINGGSLPAGDKLARMSDLTTRLNDPAVGTVSIVRSSGILDENNIITAVAPVAPFILETSSRVWVKGNVCYVSVSLRVPAQVTAAPSGVVIPLCTGLPGNPGPVSAEANGLLLAVSRYRRLSVFGSVAAVAGDPATQAGSFISGLADITADGGLYLASGGYSLFGNATANYNDWITISGHYLISLADSV